MDSESFRFHRAEKGHLALGELMDRRRELEPHRIFVYESEKILRNKLIFKAIIDKIIGADSAFEKGAHLFDKTAFDPASCQ